MRKGSRTSYPIGTKGTSCNGVSYEVVGYCTDAHYRIIEVDGRRLKVRLDHIKGGSFRTRYETDVYGCCPGDIPNATKHPLYERWRGMIRRCYYKGDVGYKSYGAKGVTVSDELKCFANYVGCLQKDENYNNLISDPKKWHVDKDLKGGKVYSPSTIKILPAEENIRISQKVIPIIATKGQKTLYFESVKKASIGLNSDDAYVGRAAKHGWKVRGWSVTYA